jgi:hypothetical protein
MTALEVEAAKSNVPVKEAVMEFKPTGSEVRLIAASPFFIVAEPTGRPLLRKDTVPLVTGLFELVTAAVAVTFEPYSRIGEEKLNTVKVTFGFTVTSTAFETEDARSDVPP